MTKAPPAKGSEISLETILLDRYRVVTLHKLLRSTWGKAIDTSVDHSNVVYFKAPSEAGRIHIEVEELQRAREATIDVNSVGLPEVLAFDVNHGVMITQYIPAVKSAFNYLWEQTSFWRLNRFGLGRPEQIGGLLGSWLKCYRESSRSIVTTDGNAVVDSSARGAAGRLGRLTGWPGGCVIRPDTADRVINDLRRLQETICTSSTTAFGTIHGDLNLSNVLICRDGRLFIIDFGDTRPGLSHEDFVNVWHTIWGISKLSQCRHRLLTPCLEALLKNYVTDRDDFVQSAAFQFLRRTTALVQILAGVSHARQFGRFGAGAHRRLAEVNRRWLESGCPAD